MSTHDQVAHAWANQTGRDKRGHSMSYQGNKLYSYSTCIAELTTDHYGRPSVLIAQNNWGIATGRHLWKASRATRHLQQFELPVFRNHYHKPREAFLLAQVQHLKESAFHTFRALFECQFLSMEHLQQYKQTRIDAANLLIYHFNLDHEWITSDRDLFPSSYSIAAIDDTLLRLAARFGRGETARRDHARVLEQRAARAARDARAKRPAENLALIQWLKNETPYIPRSSRRPYVRVRGDVVETTWGASVPLADAKRLFRMARDMRSTHRSFTPAIMIRAGHFALTEITPLGTLVIGCHRIPWHVQRIAARLGGIEL